MSSLGEDAPQLSSLSANAADTKTNDFTITLETPSTETEVLFDGSFSLGTTTHALVFLSRAKGHRGGTYMHM